MDAEGWARAGEDLDAPRLPLLPRYFLSCDHGYVLRS